ncbi:MULTISPECIES: hypothetical protein [unclassified Pseudomonas]|uniref:hypothetical protein n=1 Tax=unclassified Pseudomonas TaxID=196821 RepID=UPI00244D26F4|nr:MULTISPECIES: hypothetical protein [unclassified Pseudomonas]MDG9925924.1 hypothetical protein [Pseudomonas sp. GD04045]MDH0034828.1 hypothetical protein [Pseudomonas sp. GD04019]
MAASPGQRVAAWFLLSVALLAICLQPRLLWFIAGLVVLGLWMVWRDRRYLARLAAQRQGESICQFARAFPRRQVDTWVIRAVYESLHGYLGGRLPIRADDRLKQDLRLDDDDLDLDLLADMARLSGRSLERTADNPWFDRVSSVRDLVLFLDQQPRLSAT